MWYQITVTSIPLNIWLNHSQLEIHQFQCKLRVGFTIFQMVGKHPCYIYLYICIHNMKCYTWRHVHQNMTYMYENVSSAFCPWLHIIYACDAVFTTCWTKLSVLMKGKKPYVDLFWNLSLETYRHTQETQMCTHKMSVLLRWFISSLCAFAWLPLHKSNLNCKIFPVHCIKQLYSI